MKPCILCYLTILAEDIQVWVVQESHHLITKAMDVIQVASLCNFQEGSKLDLDYKLPVDYYLVHWATVTGIFLLVTSFMRNILPPFSWCCCDDRLQC